jgi:guanylate kinase
VRTEISGLILFGPPAVGKDTITGHLTALDQRYVQFERLKAGPGRTTGYRIVGLDEFEAVRGRGEMLYANSRYGAQYGIDRGGLEAIANAERIPVVHVGQLAGVRQVVVGMPLRWLVVILWCSREVAATRLAQRADAQPAERLRAWDQTLADVQGNGVELADLAFNTATWRPEDVAQVISASITKRSGSAIGGETLQ